MNTRLYLMRIVSVLSLLLVQSVTPFHVLAQTVSTFAGSGAAGFNNATGTSAQFNSPTGTAVDAAGNIYVADKLNHRIRKITSAGVVTTLAGSGVAGFNNATGTAAQFDQPNGVAVDGAGNVYVADAGNHRIRKITSVGVVTTLSGSGMGGFNDGASGAVSQFNFPYSVALDGAGNVYVADFLNHRIRVVDPVSGAASTLAGSGTAGFMDATGAAAQFNFPTGVALDGAGNVYVADQLNNRIRRITSAGVVTTLAGSGTAGFANGTGISAQFSNPAGVALDGAGNVYVADQGNNRIRSITPAGVVSTLAGSGSAGFMDATGLTAQFNAPAGVAVDGTGNVYVADQSNHRIRMITPPPVPTITSFTPTTAAAGVTVTINGTNFLGAGAVSFGGVTATSFTVVSATQITAVVATGGASGSVAVTAPGGTATLAGFTFIPPPTITSFTPTYTGLGTTVTITGTNFTGATAVSFGGTAAASFMVVSATQITAVLAAGASGSVSVTAPGGTATLAGFTFAPPPTITSFTPTSAAIGATVTINGTNFTGATQVRFGGVAATSFMVVSATQITAVVAAGGASGNVQVTAPGGVANLAGFTFIAPPTITSFTPTSAGTGLTVTITGTNFTGATAVSFGGTAAASFMVVSATQITAVVAAGATGTIQVITPGGMATSAGMFTYVLTPTITSFAPTSASPGATITITGTNLSGTTAVSFGGTAAASFMNVSATQVTAVVGVGASGNVQLITPGGTATLAGFTFVPSAPTITSFAPASRAAGQTVTINGTNFTGATAVSFGGVAAASFMVVSATQITAVVAAGGASGSVSVTTPGGTITSPGFSFVPAPTIISFLPTSRAAGQTVTIVGTNLTGTTAVSFGGTPAASFMVINDFLMTAVVGSGATGSVSVTTPGGTVTSPGFTFTFLMPTITSFTPTSAAAGATVTITGTNFTGATQVRFGGVNAASFIVVSSTQITAVVAAGGATGNVSVTTPGGTANLAGFTFLPPPTVTSFTPTSAAAGATVTINGTNFTGVTQVRFGGTNAASFTFISATQVTAVVAAGASGSVSVITPDGTGSLPGFTFIPAPTITSFTPTSRGTGLTVTITGTGFTGATAVSFGGTAATSFMVVSATQITAVVAAGATGSVSVTTPGGTANLAGFTFVLPPTITSFAPTTAAGGATVTITGTNFTGATAVSFGGTAAASFMVISATQINAVVAAGGATGNVSVTTNGGTATLGGFTFIPPPTITSFTPTSGGLGATITINGTNFTGATLVEFGGTAASSFTIVSATQITAVVNTGTSGLVRVTTPGGIATQAGFNFIPAPTITSFTPTMRGTGMTVTITGTNFTGATAVSFGGTAAASFMVVSATQINAVVAAGATGSVSVTTPGGTGTLAGFTFVPVPTITGISPTSAMAGATVTINGTNFSTATGVSFGGTAATSFMIVSATQITAVVGPGASGNVVVTTAGGTGTLVAGFTFIFSPPTITSFTPTSAGAGQTVTINGTNFTGASAVSFGGVAATSFTVVSATQITAVVAAGSASGNVSVTTPGGTGVLGGFTFILPPTISSFTPTSAGIGQTVTITGTNFTGATAVSFGGTAAGSFTVVSATQITAVLAGGASGSISVTTPGGTGTLAGFTYLFFIPTISSFTPTSMGAGGTVTITGTNFIGVSAVSFGGTAAASFTVISPTQINAVVGAGANGSISITTPGGTVTQGGFTFIPPPSITSFTPTSAAQGVTVTITGTNFIGATGVSFGGTAATSFSVVSSTQITAVVAAGASGAVAVTTPGGTGTLAGFTFIAPPNITSFTPTSAAAGATVTLTGTNFTGVTAVSFGGTAAASFTVVSSTQITAVVAVGSASGNVSATGPGGTGTLGGFTFINPPAITSFTPTSAAAGATVLINGSNFTGATAVTFGGTAAASFTVITPFLMTAVVASGASGNLVVTSPGGTGTRTGFTFVAGPMVTSFSPTGAGPGLTVTITGAGFTGATAVSFGGMAASSFTVVSATQITAVVGGGGASGSISVTTPGGTSTLAGFTFVPPPTVTSFTPTSGPPGTMVSIIGTNFSGATAVSFGGVAVSSFTVVSATQIAATISTGATGSVSVSTPGGTANLAGFTFVAPMPTISSFTPAFAAGGTAVTITGTGFSGATAVSFGGVAASSFTVVSPTQMTAIVSAGGASGIVSVTTPGGTATRSGFSFVAPPTITGFVPASAPAGATVTISGTNFTGATAANFGGIAPSSFTVVSPTQISAVIGAGASGNVSVTTTGGTATLAGFTFIPAPAISNFTPLAAGPGFTVSILGANFSGVTAVRFGGVLASSFTVVSPSQITATISTGASGSISVTSTGGTGSLAGFTFVLPPTITSFTPTSSGTGTAITIIGTNFTGATSVRFGGVPANSYTINSPTQITAVVSLSGASGNITVSTPGGTASLAGFTYLPTPTITSFSPQSGEPGTTITILGTNFTGATAVNFGTATAASFTVVSPTQITAIVPGNAGGTIAIATPGGTATRSGFNFIPAPTITGFIPSSAGPGQTVTISGTNLTNLTEVRFGGIKAKEFTVISAAKITAVVADEGASGSVEVVSPDGKDELAGFTFIPPVPIITSFSPTVAGPGMTITISGTGLLGASSVSLGGVSAVVSAISLTQITALVTTGASGIVSVVTPGGTATSPGFVFVPAPVITRVNPITAVPGTTVTITGVNFTGTTSVRFGGVAARDFSVISDSVITAVVSGSGNVVVTTPGGTAVSTGFTTIPPPIVTGFMPTIATSGATITIEGVNFVGVRRVSFGGIEPRSFTVLSPTQITAVVATGATGSVAVTTTAGTASLSGFTYVAPPTITGFTPANAGAGTAVTISGTNFISVSTVSFGGVTAASFTVVSPTQIIAVLATNANNQSGDIALTTPGGTVSKSGFTFIPPPMVTGFTPTSAGPGALVSISGQHFIGATLVRFGGVTAASFTVVADTLITAEITSAGASGSISVTSTGGTGSLEGFVYVAPSPTITRFTPTSAGAGMTVTIEGTNFVGVSNLRFGGVAAASFTVISPTRIVATLASGADGSVSLTTITGTASLQGFTFIPLPAITSFTPTSAGAGMTVNIIGTNFIGVSSVRFGGITAASFTAVSPTQITAVVATGASGSVSVTALGGTGSRAGFTLIPPPTVTSFTPTSAGAGTTITINGTNFSGATAVNFGGVAVSSFVVVSPTRITAVVAQGTFGGAISVTTPGGTGSLGGFTFISIPSVLSFSPTSAGVGTTIVITGANFTTNASVSFGGVAAASVTVISPTQIRATVPVNTTGGTVSVTTQGGTASLGGFSLINAPRVFSFSPMNAPIGTMVTITGANLTGVTSVRFGGILATGVVGISATEVRAVVGTGASGSVSVTTPGGTGALAGFTFIGAPSISGFTPTSAGFGKIVTIIGTNFSAATSVSFGGMPAARYTVLSPTQITAVVGTGASGSVAVSGLGGNGSLSGFTFIPAPVITAFSPVSGAIGQVVTIAGRNFSGASAVAVGGISIPFVLNNDGQITFTIPLTGVTTGIITVASPGGVGLSQQIFRFIPPPSISSAEQVQSRQGLILRISGANFTGTTLVNIGRVNVPFTVINSSQVTASIPAGVSQSDIVRVFTPGGMAQNSGTTLLPFISAVSPSRGGPGTRIIVTGQNLANTTQASIGGVLVQFQVMSSTQVELTVPQAGAFGTIGLTTPLGVVTTTSTFTLITSQPFIADFAPKQGDIGTMVSISGENLSDVNDALIGGVSVPFRIVSATEIILTIPQTGATTGSIVLVSPLGIALSNAAFVFTPGGVIPPTKPSIPLGTIKCYPNPASDNITIAYTLEVPQAVTIYLLDILGNTLNIVEKGIQDGGEYTAILPLIVYGHGTYMVVVETPTRRMQALFSIIR